MKFSWCLGLPGRSKMASLTCLCLGRKVWKAGLSCVPFSFHVVSGPLGGGLSSRPREDMAAHRFHSLLAKAVTGRDQIPGDGVIGSPFRWGRGKVTFQKTMWNGRYCCRHFWKVKSTITGNGKVMKQKRRKTVT